MVDGERLREVMRLVPSPVTVVTVQGAEEMRGITIGSFASTSLAPPLISFNVDKTSQVHDLLAEASHFAVHLLNDEQAYLSDRFARSDQSGQEQFDGLSHHAGPHNVPVIEGVLAVLYCARYAVYEAGDHSIFLGEVIGVEETDKEKPLLYFNRSYRSLGAEVTSNLLSPVKRVSSDTP